MRTIRRIEWLLLAAGFAATLSQPSLAQGIPQGLDCGLGYIGRPNNGEIGVCNGTPTVTTTTTTVPVVCHSTLPNCGSCLCAVGSFCDVNNSCVTGNTITQTVYNFNPNAAAGYAAYDDGDTSLGSNQGYVHQEATTAIGSTNVADSQNFVLPQGAICGFHHTANTAGHTCMGFDPANATNGCPPGWTRRSAGDTNSNNQHWVWCEYQDNFSKSVGQPVVAASGLPCGVSSNNTNDGPIGTPGVCMGYDVRNASWSTPNCPGMTSSLWEDDGQSAGNGVGFCTITGNQLPPHAAPPPPPPSCKAPLRDCCDDGSVCLKSCAGAGSMCH